MRVLFIGDVVGEPGRRAIKTLLPKLKSSEKLDFVIANAEKGDHLCALALKIEAYRLKKYIGSYMSVLGRLDAVFLQCLVDTFERLDKIRAGAATGVKDDDSLIGKAVGNFQFIA